MAYTFTEFDPTTYTIGQEYELDTKGVNTNEQIMIYNDSTARMKFTYANGDSDIIPAAWNKDKICVLVPMGKISVIVLDLLSAPNYPEHKCYGTIYENDEHVASVNASMQRGFSITNSGGIPMTNTSLNNTGNPDGTNWLDVQSGNSPSWNFTADNDGNFGIAVWDTIAKVRTNVFNVIAGATTAIKMGAIGFMTEFVEQVNFDNGFICSGNSVFDSAYTLHDSGALIVDSYATFNSQVLFVEGTITRMKHYVGTGNQTVTHGLGGIPQMVWPVDGSASPAAISAHNWTSTTFQITTETGNIWNCYALY